VNGCISGHTCAENFGFSDVENADRQLVGPKRLVFPEKMGYAIRTVFSICLKPEKNGHVSFGKTGRFSKNAGKTSLFVIVDVHDFHDSRKSEAIDPRTSVEGRLRRMN
jgi:hypothetical protein